MSKIMEIILGQKLRLSFLEPPKTSIKYYILIADFFLLEIQAYQSDLAILIVCVIKYKFVK